MICFLRNKKIGINHFQLDIESKGPEIYVILEGEANYRLYLSVSHKKYIKVQLAYKVILSYVVENYVFIF